MSDARTVATDILTTIEKNGAYSVLAVSEEMKKTAFPDSRDKSFAVSLVYGVLEHKITLDYNIGLYLTGKINKLKKNVLNILRVGAYQILFTDNIPVSASVNEAVKCAKRMGASYASGMVNAVLRKVASNGLVLPTDDSKFSVKYSVNADIFNSIAEDYGIDKAESVFEAFFGRRPIYIRCNKYRCSSEELIESLQNDGVYVEKTSLDGCFVIDNTGDITHLRAYKDGMFYVQDMSSQMCCSVLGAKDDDIVLDCCAAPGGKSFTLAQYLTENGAVYSCDIHKHKTELIEKSAKRLGIDNINVICSDARDLGDKVDFADKVLCDVPCSGFGVIGRKPEIRYKHINELDSLPSLQKEILYAVAKTVRVGGTLIYSTCTLRKRENDDICDAFLKDFPNFSIAEDEKYRSFTDKYITVFPSENGGDGFFVAKFVRTEK